MPLPKTDSWYAGQVGALAEEGWKPGTIAQWVRESAIRYQRTDIPSDRTFRRLYAEHKEKLPEARQLAAYVKWPESFSKDGPLPWEAAPAVLELLRLNLSPVPVPPGAHPQLDELQRTGLSDHRPTVRIARHFWHLRTSAPGADPRTLLALAKYLTFEEILGGIPPGSARAVWGALIFRAGEEDSQWELAVSVGMVPPLKRNEPPGSTRLGWLNAFSETEYQMVGGRLHLDHQKELAKEELVRLQEEGSNG